MSSNRVLVIGGGYAGVVAANRLLKRDDVDVTLINPRATFVERIRLHQLVAGSHEAVRDYADVLHERVRLVVDTVERIDAPARTVRLSSGETRSYDYLVYAVGSRSARLEVPGASEHAYPLGALEQAERLRAALARTPAGAPITVVGAGPTGIEIAGELAEAGRPVTIVCDVLGPYLSEGGRRSAAAALQSLGVTVLDGAMVTEVEPASVHLADGARVQSSITIWTAGFTTPDLASRSGLATDAVGRLVTDETLTSVDDPRILAAGDAADPSGQPVRMSCQAAIPLGLQAAETVLSRLAGSAPRPIDSGFTGQCISVGRRLGIYQVARSDDTVRGVAVGGRSGAWIKETVCRGVAWMLTQEARHPGRLGWFRDRSRAERVRASRTEVSEAA